MEDRYEKRLQQLEEQVREARESDAWVEALYTGRQAGSLGEPAETILHAADALPSIRTVAYQGKEGSYSARAAGLLFPGLPSKGWADVQGACRAVVEGEAQVVVLPLDNSTAGTVNEVYDRMLEFRLHIIRSISISIRHSLLGVPGTRMEEIREIHSHPQALAQCAGYIRRQGWKGVPAENTAFAAEMVALRRDPEVAAVGSSEAAAIFGLEVIQEGISDQDCNQTRFVALTRQACILPGASRVSLAFMLPHESGSLLKALSVFSDRGLNLTKIQSRPLMDKPWEYCFYLDFQAQREDDGPGGEARRGLQALCHLARFTPELVFLGWYPEIT